MPGFVAAKKEQKMKPLLVPGSDVSARLGRIEETDLVC